MFEKFGGISMRVFEIYDFDKDGKERLKEIKFLEGHGDATKSHGYSYIHARKELKDMGIKMGFDRLREIR